MRRAVRDVARLHDLPDDWLSDAAKGFADILPPDFYHRLTSLPLPLQRLHVYVLGRPDQAAMKIVALCTSKTWKTWSCYCPRWTKQTRQLSYRLCTTSPVSGLIGRRGWIFFFAGAGMADPVDRLFQEWQQLGGQVLFLEVHSAPLRRAPEQVIAESTAHCRESGRLTWVTLDWLIRHVEQLDENRLLRETRKRGDLSVLGLLRCGQPARPAPEIRARDACVQTDRHGRAVFSTRRQKPIGTGLDPAERFGSVSSVELPV